MSVNEVLDKLDEYQYKAAIHPLGSAGIVIAGAGAGKCLTLDTPVLMFDGTIKPVQHVVPGEQLMGPDSAPRRVLSTTRGTGDLYTITPVKGEPWGCNDAHILVLAVSGQRSQEMFGAEVEVTVADLLRDPRCRFRKDTKLFRVAVDFPSRPVPLDPYFVGLWLGDGNSDLSGLAISKPDVEIRDYLGGFAEEFGLQVTNRERRDGFCPVWALTSGNTKGQARQGRNYPLTTLQGLGLAGNKHIPPTYKVNSREVRLQLLAGIIDSDGYLPKSSVQVVTKYRPFAEDIAFVCRSLGLAAYIAPTRKTCTNTGVSGDYFSISISGDLSIIPVKIPRRKAEPRRQIKSVLRTGFTITPKGRGDYYGFTLDGDGRFLLGDFTVTHNTATMTARVRWALDQGIPERTLCVVTFTNKAANELRHRIGFGKDPSVGPRVSTIHSLSLSAIRKDPIGFGLSPRVTPLDTGDSKDFLERLLTLRKKDPKFAELKPWNVLEKINYHRARGIGFIPDYTEAYHRQVQHIHSGLHALVPEELVLWGEYEQLKKSSSVVDFEDMLHLVVRRGREDATWRDRVQSQFNTVLVDEFQDTSVVQCAFVELLLPPDNPNLYVVGDTSQSIYGFNGASPEILMGMTKDWRGTVPVLYKLENNYRSVSKVVNLANRIQQTMTGTVPLTMHAKRVIPPGGFEGKVAVISGTTPRDIAQNIAEAIVTDNRLKSSPFKFKDNAILVRAASQIPDLESALVSCRIPYVVRDGISLLQTEEAKDLFSYMKLVANPKDVSAFARAIATPTRGVGPVAIEKVRKIAMEKFDGDILQACCAYEHMTLRPWGQAVTEMSALTDSAELFSKVIKFTGYRDILVQRYRKDRDRLETKLQNLERLKDALIGLVQDNPTATTADIIFRVTMDGKAEATTPDGAVTISTVHSGKGLEWPRVYVVNLIEGSIPIRYARTDAEIEEERRLFYVAVTRARDALVLGVPKVVMRGPNSARVQPSRFLGELGIRIAD